MPQYRLCAAAYAACTNQTFRSKGAAVTVTTSATVATSATSATSTMVRPDQFERCSGFSALNRQSRLQCAVCFADVECYILWGVFRLKRRNDFSHKLS